MSDQGYDVAAFKLKFPHDFTYLSVITWSSTKTYYAGDEVYYDVTGLFYVAMATQSGISPTDDPAVWQEINDSTENYVSDDDIQRAYNEADCVFNPNLAGTPNQKLQQYMYLSAHYLCLDKRIISAGMSGSLKAQVTSVSVGSVSESYQIPDKWTSNMMLFPFTLTSYGLIYLSFVAPALVGNVAVVEGATIP